MTKPQTVETLSIENCQRRLADAEDAVTKVIEQVGAAADEADRARRDLEERETAVVDGTGISTRVALDKARAGIEQARADLQWAELQHRAAQAAEQRSYEDLRLVQQELTRAEYLQAHAQWNDPQNREAVLMEQLAACITELTHLAHDRRALHSRLSQAYSAIPAEERFAIPEGRRIGGEPVRYAPWNVEVSSQAQVEVIDKARKTALEAIRAQTQAATHAARLAQTQAS